ncbi:hypothetical protein [Subtercola sp. Z020]|uniref:hypothetical protein n=1 Tax=Subtercola sp. Z020 TaxID=2080582 RepID=UPI0011B02745|nr:hypothetical protein [Subtercola sp. Z020]
MNSTAGLDHPASNQSRTEQAYQLLSAVPFFDLETGASIISLIDGELAESDHRSWAESVMFDLLANGAFENVRNILRVAASTRESMFPVVLLTNPAGVQQALNIFLSAAEDSLNESLVAILGIRGREVTVQTLDVVANPSDVNKLNTLIDTVHRSSRLLRSRDSWSSAELLRAYGLEEERTYQFMRGLALWQNGLRASASREFTDVLTNHRNDRAEAVAAHLLGVFRHDQGKSAEAVKLFIRAEKVLRSLEDHRGLAITHTTHGRVLREMARRESSDDLRHSALKQYQTARKNLSKIPREDAVDSGKTEGRINLGEGQALFELGDREEGMRLVALAVSIFSTSLTEQSWARLTLAGMYRDVDNHALALDILRKDTYLLDSDDDDDIHRGHALNVLASIERHALPHNLDLALGHALRSVAIGERLQDERHVAHALVTLSYIQIDLLDDGFSINDSEVRVIRRNLYRAQDILRTLHDRLGLARVDDAFSNIQPPRTKPKG